MANLVEAYALIDPFVGALQEEVVEGAFENLPLSASEPPAFSSYDSFICIHFLILNFCNCIKLISI